MSNTRSFFFLLLGFQIVLSGALFLWLDQTKQDKSTELTLQRLNIVEADGTQALVLANAAKLPGANLGSYESESRGAPGILFYNQVGDECGGLIFDSEQTDSTFFSYQHLSFDQHENDQVLVLTNYQEADYHRKGFTINDLPYDHTLFDFYRDIDAKLAADSTLDREMARRMVLRELYQSGKGMRQRVFVGVEDGESMVQLHDTKGRVRLKLAVGEASEAPRIEVFDTLGNPTLVAPL